MAMECSEACRKIIWSNINSKPMVKKHRSPSTKFYPEMAAAFSARRAFAANFDEKGQPILIRCIIRVGLDDFIGLADAMVTARREQRDQQHSATKCAAALATKANSQEDYLEINIIKNSEKDADK